MKIVAIKDGALDGYMQPWYVPSTGVAVRAFKDQINSQESPMSQHPEDYELYYIGTFNTDKGTIEYEDNAPKLLARGKDFHETIPNQQASFKP